MPKQYTPLPSCGPEERPTTPRSLTCRPIVLPLQQRKMADALTRTESLACSRSSPALITLVLTTGHPSSLSQRNSKARLGSAASPGCSPLGGLLGDKLGRQDFSASGEDDYLGNSTEQLQLLASRSAVCRRSESKPRSGSDRSLPILHNGAPRDLKHPSSFHGGLWLDTSSR
ncbi:uncharacterized protein LY79DRAFT_575832 [Colletotrichum navitas]|uniref:Uncharacterized protein n=1 Tax=Colletotrichum navitas TaxID=681940 RepID=A0AAD8VA43_9PEZI|nr:uncharacterized protein LY79DRAFT_575832 [Colletotrichum navitas]KAK1598669.1 hypothetical protein LY79DRAFT_575832 [Colletotrichum navitas]